jgi:hypothetical protein
MCCYNYLAYLFIIKLVISESITAIAKDVDTAAITYDRTMQSIERYKNKIDKEDEYDVRSHTDRRYSACEEPTATQCNKLENGRLCNGQGGIYRSGEVRAGKCDAKC